jgi:hypothetical protein
VQARARERGLSVNAAVCELVERGLEASADERCQWKASAETALDTRIETHRGHLPGELRRMPR